MKIFRIFYVSFCFPCFRSMTNCWFGVSLALLDCISAVRLPQVGAAVGLYKEISFLKNWLFIILIVKNISENKMFRQLHTHWVIQGFYLSRAFWERSVTRRQKIPQSWVEWGLCLFVTVFAKPVWLGGSFLT